MLDSDFLKDNFNDTGLENIEFEYNNQNGDQHSIFDLLNSAANMIYSK